MKTATPKMESYHYAGSVAGHRLTGSLSMPNDGTPDKIRFAAAKRHVIGVAHRKFKVSLRPCERNNSIRFRKS